MFSDAAHRRATPAQQARGDPPGRESRKAEEKKMRPIHTRLCVLLMAAPAAAHADLLVTPTFTHGEHGNNAHGLVWPHSAHDLETAVDPTAFESSSFGHRTLGENRWAVRSGYATEFFYEHPTGEINRSRLRGHADLELATSATAPRTIAATALASASAQFIVTEPVAFTLRGLIEAAAHGEGDGSGLNSYVVSLDPQFGLELYYTESSSFTDNTINVDVSGVLQPGHYALFASVMTTLTATGASAEWAGGTSFDLTLELAAIPAPGVGALLPGLLLATRRRR